MKTIKRKEKVIDNISIYENKTIMEIVHFEIDIEIHDEMSNSMLF